MTRAIPWVSVDNRNNVPTENASPRRILCALDTGNIEDALGVVRRLSPHVGGFKIGHALTLPYGLEVVSRLQDAGAKRIFLDLKFHDIPNSVALAVREAARRGVWMMTLHISGGPAMLTAAMEEARGSGAAVAPLLVGVSVLTSIDQHTLSEYFQINRSVEELMLGLSKIAMECDLDGVVCSPQEVRVLRRVVGHGIIVTPGIRVTGSEAHDQKRTGTAMQALEDGSDYLVVGRALTDSSDPVETLSKMGFETAGV